MLKTPRPAILKELRHINEVLQEHGELMASIRADLSIQFKRIADIQAELDTLPSASQRRNSNNAPSQSPPSKNGDGRSH